MAMKWNFAFLRRVTRVDNLHCVPGVPGVSVRYLTPLSCNIWLCATDWAAAPDQHSPETRKILRNTNIF